MASSTAQVKKTSLRKDNDTIATLKHETIHLRLDVDALRGLLETSHIDLIIKVTNVANNGIVLHLAHGISHEN
eukprot:CAMPEP_0172525162 /NCGR_PEP_ID=MMETSP1067-20121228/196_1 /TAXON_ID=265564 ORGANISM="Thalassiosira punctigera, Strain Tpunct2005C2" /NCGR_SAMPLE_ID=MMETSP1067 /ASSEMBLY_ACC=CAM_ASM_000444 /LENGTH=72 /DNA_ID=CAMNT_0013308363 /DNA_START=9 /DNA_END=224 /DNA_ORIENTATION=+